MWWSIDQQQLVLSRRAVGQGPRVLLVFLGAAARSAPEAPRKPTTGGVFVAACCSQPRRDYVYCVTEEGFLYAFARRPASWSGILDLGEACLAWRRTRPSIQSRAGARPTWSGSGNAIGQDATASPSRCRRTSITVPCRSAAWRAPLVTRGEPSPLISSGTGALLESSPATAQTFWRVFGGNK